MKSKLVWALLFFAFCVSTTVTQVADRKRKKAIDFAFHEFDANKDYKLSEKEFAGSKMGEAKENARMKFRKLDKDGDKSLSVLEYKNSEWSLSKRGR